MSNMRIVGPSKYEAQYIQDFIPYSGAFIGVLKRRKEKQKKEKQKKEKIEKRKKGRKERKKEQNKRKK